MSSNGYQANFNIPYKLSPKSDSENIYRFIKITPIWIFGKINETPKFTPSNDLSSITLASVSQSISKKSYIILSKPSNNLTNVTKEIDQYEINNLKSGSYYLGQEPNQYFTYLLNSDNYTETDFQHYYLTAARTGATIFGLNYDLLIITGNSLSKITAIRDKTFWSGKWSDVINNSNLTAYRGNQITKIKEGGIVGYDKIIVPKLKSNINSDNEIESYYWVNINSESLLLKEKYFKYEEKHVKPKNYPFNAMKFNDSISSETAETGFETHVLFIAELQYFYINKQFVMYIPEK